MTEETIPQKGGFVNVFILYSCRILFFMITFKKKYNVSSTEYKVQITEYNVA